MHSRLNCHMRGVGRITVPLPGTPGDGRVDARGIACGTRHHSIAVGWWRRRGDRRRGGRRRGGWLARGDRRSVADRTVGESGVGGVGLDLDFVEKVPIAYIMGGNEGKSGASPGLEHCRGTVAATEV